MIKYIYIFILFMSNVSLAEHFKVDEYKPSDLLISQIDNICKQDLSWVESIIIEGHTDSRGDELYNLKLSKNRAEAVKKLLEERCGINGKKIKTIGMGKLYPVSDNHDDNRRVEMHFIGTKQVTYVLRNNGQSNTVLEQKSKDTIISLIGGNSYNVDWNYNGSQANVYLRNSIDLGILYQTRISDEMWFLGGALLPFSGTVYNPRYLLGVGVEF